MDVADYIGAIGSIVLGVLGAIVSLDAFTGKKRWCWVAAFSLVGLVSTAAAVVSIRSGKIAEGERANLQKRIDAGVTGADNFCFFEAIIINPHDFNSPVPVRLVNTGNAPVRNIRYLRSPYWIGGNANHPDYYSIQKNGDDGIEICPVGLSYPNPVIRLKPGRYRIEFTPLLATRDSKPGWAQILTIEQSYDRLVTVTDITFNDGRKPYRSPRPPDYREW